MKIAAIMTCDLASLDQPRTHKVYEILKEKGWDVVREVEPRWTGFMQKVRWAHQCAKDLTDYTHLMLVDARDIVMLATPTEVLERFLKFDHPWVFAAEPHIWPRDMGEPEDYPECEGYFRYLNSGAFIGEREYMLECYERWPKSGDQMKDIIARGEDGPFYTERYLHEPGVIKLDHGCELFQCMCGAAWMCTSEYGDLHNFHMDTHPPVIHFNGGSNIMDDDKAILYTDPTYLKALDWVGMPAIKDKDWACQIETLMKHGLKPEHEVLEVGAGVLGVGKMLIEYLDPRNYWAVEPHKWLVKAAKVDRKLFHLYTFSDFKLTRTRHTFDYVFAYSVFTHSDRKMIRTQMEEAYAVLKPNGKLIASFYDPHCGDSEHEGWVYPGGVSYTTAFIKEMAEDVGFHATMDHKNFTPCGHSWLFGRKL